MRKRNPGCPCCCEYCEIAWDDFDAEDLDSRWVVQNGSFTTAAGDLLVEGEDEESRAYWSEAGCFVSMVAVVGSISVELYSSAKIFICQGEGVVGYFFAEIEKTSEAEPNDYAVSIGEADGPSIGANETVLESDTFSGDLSEVKLCFNAMLNKLTLEIEGNVILEGYPTVSVGEPTGRKGGLGAVHVGASTVTFNNFRLNRYDEECETCNANCTQCCDDGLPTSVDVTVPALGGACGEGGDTYNATRYHGFEPLGGVENPFFGCRVPESPVSQCAVYRYEEAISGGAFTIFVVFEFEVASEMCRVAVMLARESIFVRDIAAYQSDLFYPGNCAAESWECAFECSEEEGCDFDEGTVTVDAA